MTNNNYIFTDSQDKLNLIGAFYESINSPRHFNSDTYITQMVDKSAEKFKAESTNLKEHSVTITQFNNSNKASNPDSVLTHIHQFSNTTSVGYILKNLPNKTSCGLDNIPPPLVLKYLPSKMSKKPDCTVQQRFESQLFSFCLEKSQSASNLRKKRNPMTPQVIAR